MTINCSVCQETKPNFVNFKCNHKICLKCYSYMIYHNHTKCPMCRKNIRQLEHLTEMIVDLENDIENLENEVKTISEDKQDLEDLLDKVENEKEDLEYKLIDFENYYDK